MSYLELSMLETSLAISFQDITVIFASVVLVQVDLALDILALALGQLEKEGVKF